MKASYVCVMGRSYPEERLRDIRGKRRMRTLKLAALGALSLFGGIIFMDYFYGSIALGWNYQFITVLSLFLISLISFSLMLYYLKPTEYELKFKSGVEGERYFKKYLDKIEGYKFYDVPLPHGGDIDALLISTKGIFAFEVKNLSGIIKCEGDNWERIKIGKGGKKYKGHVGKPSEEARRHALDLQSHLSGRGINVNVIPVVVMSSPKSELQCDRCSVRVIKPEQIKNILKSPDMLSNSMVKRIKNEIKRMYYR